MRAAVPQTTATKWRQASHSSNEPSLLQRKCACGSATSSMTGRCEQCATKKTLGLQAKLKIGKSGDIYEQEADRVAFKVMTISDSEVPEVHRISAFAGPESTERSLAVGKVAAQRTVFSPPSISRLDEAVVSRAGYTPADARDSELPPDDNDVTAEQENDIQRSSIPHSPGIVTRQTEAALQGIIQAGGEPLPAHARTFMEPRFGHDFSAVRIFSNDGAARVAQSLGARAFTSRQRIFFASGEYQPSTLKGRMLLAHELTHVIQQRSPEGRLQRQTEIIQMAAHPCPSYGDFDKGADVETYNCTGLAHRNYKFIGLADTKTLLSGATSVDCAKSCPAWKIGSPPHTQHWLWEYDLHIENDTGKILQGPRKDFHTVGGMIDDKGSDMKRVYTKNGKRPVYGPDTGASHKPAAKNQLKANNKSDKLVTDALGNPIYQVRSNFTESCYCTICPDKPLYRAP